MYISLWNKILSSPSLLAFWLYISLSFFYSLSPSFPPTFTQTHTHTHTECCVFGLQGVHSGEESTVWQTWGRSQIWLVHMVCGHAAPCMCVYVCVADSSLHLNIYQGQSLPKGESCAVFTGRLPNEWMKTTLHYLASYCRRALEQGTLAAVASAQHKSLNVNRGAIVNMKQETAHHCLDYSMLATIDQPSLIWEQRINKSSQVIRQEVNRPTFLLFFWYFDNQQNGLGHFLRKKLVKLCEKTVHKVTNIWLALALTCLQTCKGWLIELHALFMWSAPMYCVCDHDRRVCACNAEQLSCQ